MPNKKTASPFSLRQALVAGLALPLSCLAQGNLFGIQFNCTGEQRAEIAKGVDAYFAKTGISRDWILVEDDGQKTLSYRLKTNSLYGTLYLKWNPNYGIEDDVVDRPVVTRSGAVSTQPVSTVSKKEIALALMHEGRLTRFSGAFCTAQALIDQVGIRQNVVMWSQKLDWDWPDGGSAHWNKRYWDRGTPKRSTQLKESLMDMFQQQSKYAIGCHTATKVVYAHAILDYYSRVKGDARAAREVEQALLSDGDPLVDLDPELSFEDEFVPGRDPDQGKVLEISGPTGPGNFVPGDWAYMRNTDPVTHEKTGYEGSNTIYLGGNLFDDYYNDNGNHYSYNEKLTEVHNWRLGVFSQKRDFAKKHRLTEEEVEQLGLSPKEGGYVLSHRVVPKVFGLNP
jgi:Protein-glutamine gamma-glutamyltransferase